MMIKKEDTAALLLGMMATLAGIGIARFAYTSLLPELITAQWFSDTQAVYLGAANLLGYFIGAISAHRLSEFIPLRYLLSTCFAAIALNFMLCAQPAAFSWFFSWRFIAGVAGAILMVVGPSKALSFIPATRRSSVGAFVFTGIGIGIALSAIVIPLLVQVSLTASWLSLAMLSLLVAIVCDRSLVYLQRKDANRQEVLLTTGQVGSKQNDSDKSSFEQSRSLKNGSQQAGSQPNNSARTALSSKIEADHSGKQKWGLILLLLVIAYAFDAIGFVPHTLFWVDYLVREQQFSALTASLQWVFFGLGAILGPLLIGAIVPRIGWRRGLMIAFLLKAMAVALPLLSVDFFSRTLSSFIVGAMIPGIVALTSGRIAELVGAIEHKKYWGSATAVFAVAQAISGYGMSLFYANSGSYQPLFAVAASILLLGFLLLLLSEFLIGGKTAKSEASTLS